MFCHNIFDKLKKSELSFSCMYVVSIFTFLNFSNHYLRIFASQPEFMKNVFVKNGLGGFVPTSSTSTSCSTLCWTHLNLSPPIDTMVSGFSQSQVVTKL